MFAEDEQQQQQNRQRRPFCLLLTIALIILLPIESVIESKKAETAADAILAKLANNTESVKQPISTDLIELLGVLDNAEYEGRWIATDTEKNSALDSSDGRVQLIFQKVYDEASIVYGVFLKLFHQQYSDSGYIVLLLKPSTYNATEQYTQGRYEEVLLEPVLTLYDKVVRVSTVQSNSCNRWLMQSSTSQSLTSRFRLLTTSRTCGFR